MECEFGRVERVAVLTSGESSFSVRPLAPRQTGILFNAIFLCPGCAGGWIHGLPQLNPACEEIAGFLHEGIGAALFAHLLARSTSHECPDFCPHIRCLRPCGVIFPRGGVAFAGILTGAILCGGDVALDLVALLLEELRCVTATGSAGRLPEGIRQRFDPCAEFCHLRIVSNARAGGLNITKRISTGTARDGWGNRADRGNTEFSGEKNQRGGEGNTVPRRAAFRPEIDLEALEAAEAEILEREGIFAH